MARPKPWWQTDHYSLDAAVPPQLTGWGGPNGIATVSVHGDKTQPGWGLLGKKLPDGSREPGFMHRYPRNEFLERITRWKYGHKREPFAFIMRSMPLLVVDIDGKNGGFLGALKLGELPRTLAETSKSGNGYHLFYRTAELWDDATGYSRFNDHIGLVPGVDIRAVGCVYHHSTQRWNNAYIELLPPQLEELLVKKEQTRELNRVPAIDTKEMDMDDVLVAHHALLTDLAQPVQDGKRNITMFAIGNKLKAAGVPDWETKVYERAIQLGLPDYEAQKLVDNIAVYGE